MRVSTKPSSRPIAPYAKCGCMDLTCMTDHLEQCGDSDGRAEEHGRCIKTGRNQAGAAGKAVSGRAAAGHLRTESDQHAAQGKKREAGPAVAKERCVGVIHRKRHFEYAS